MIHDHDTDLRLRDALARELPIPEHASAYCERLAAALAAEEQCRPRHRRRARLLTRRRLTLATAAAAAAVLALVALFGLPGARDDTGPPPVGAAEVVALAQAAMSSGHTLVADLVEWQRGSAGDPIPKTGSPYELLLASDGSYRLTHARTAADRAAAAWGDRHGLHGASQIYSTFFIQVYDASTGERLTYDRGHDGSAPKGRQKYAWASEEMGWPPGAPDPPWKPLLWTFSTWTLRDYGALACALQALKGGAVRETSYEGRSAWALSYDVAREPSGHAGWRSTVQRISITVDQLTGLPLRLQSWAGDALLKEARLENVRVDVLLSADAFTFALPQGVTATVVDGGFRRVRLAEVRDAAGRRPLVPARLPSGYRLTTVAVKAREPIDRLTRRWWLAEDTLARAGNAIVSLRYERGFDALTVTTRTIARAVPLRYSLSIDPFIGFAWTGSDQGPQLARLTSGVFAGAAARVVVAPLTAPHLWAVKDGMLLTICGAASARELVDVANSVDVHEPPL